MKKFHYEYGAAFLMKIHIRKFSSTCRVFCDIVRCNHCHNTQFALVRNPPMSILIIFAITTIALIISIIYVWCRRLNPSTIVIFLTSIPFASRNGKLLGRFISFFTFCMIIQLSLFTCYVQGILIYFV